MSILTYREFSKKLTPATEKTLRKTFGTNKVLMPLIEKVIADSVVFSHTTETAPDQNDRNSWYEVTYNYGKLIVDIKENTSVG